MLSVSALGYWKREAAWNKKMMGVNVEFMRGQVCEYYLHVSVLMQLQEINPQ